MEWLAPSTLLATFFLLIILFVALGHLAKKEPIVPALEWYAGCRKETAQGFSGDHSGDAGKGEPDLTLTRASQDLGPQIPELGIRPEITPPLM